MAQVQSAKGQIELKCDANKFFDLWARKTNLIYESCPELFPKIELHQGDSWHSLGAVATWHFIARGHAEDLVKTKVTEIDEEKRYVKYDYFVGHGVLKNKYKSLKTKIEAIPKPNNAEGCIVQWTFEYEKMTEDAPDGSVYIDFLLDTAKTMDARLCHA